MSNPKRHLWFRGLGVCHHDIIQHLNVQPPTLSTQLVPSPGVDTDTLCVPRRVRVGRWRTVHRIAELLKVFNSRTCQLVLGAGAMQVSGLRSITAKHLVGGWGVEVHRCKVLGVRLQGL